MQCALMRVSVRYADPVRLFHANVGGVQGVALPSYLAWPDGQKFLIDTVIEERPSPLRVISNWNGRESR
jgi:hypothetical protein